MDGIVVEVTAPDQAKAAISKIGGVAQRRIATVRSFSRTNEEYVITEDTCYLI